MHALIKKCSIIAGCFMASFFLRGNNSTPSNINPNGSLVILENLPGGETVDTFTANDSDPGTTLAFSLLDGNATFSIDSSGILKTKGSLDYETAQEHTIRVKVTDEHNASTEKVFTVTVLDMDEGQAPSSGSGTSQDPYLIETLAHLKWLSYTPSKQNKHYLLANDLNASETATWAQGYGFKPIASFSGSFDGRGHEIRGLTVNRPNSGNVGLFGRAWGATISQLRITQASIVGKNNVGGLAGQNVHSSSILNSSFEGSVSGTDVVGGLVGFNAHNSSIRRSSSSGSVHATGQRIGGIAGQNFTGSSITDSYSLSSLTGHRNVGGLVGLASGGTTIERSFSAGAVVGSGGFFGGFAGASFGTISDSFWDLNSSGRTSSHGSGATGKSTYQMKSLSTFTGAGWDIKASDGTWKMLQGSTYPLLSWEPLPILLPSEVFFHPGIIIENQPAGAFAGKVHALVNSYQYTPGYGNGEKVVIVQDVNHVGVSFIRGEELTVTGIGSGGTVNGRIIYRPRVDKGDLWLHRGGKGSWWEAADREVSYSLIEGNGSDHNGLFSIDEDGNLRTLSPLDYESTPSLRVRVRVNKENLVSIEKALTIPLWDDPNENLPVVVESESKSSDSDPTEQNNKTVSSPSSTPQPVVRRTPVYQVPIVRTQEARESIAGQWNFSGKITSSGNFPIFDKGFQISPSIGFETFLRLPVPLDSDKTDFNATYRTSELSPDRIYYYRSYARNAVGASFGSVRKFIPYSNSPKAWWGKTAEDQGGWRTSPWFGTFRRQTGTDWIYHAQLGWIYAQSDDRQGLWLWKNEEGWMWTRQDVFPHLWKNRTANWLYLMVSRNGKPVFYHYESGSIR